MAESRGNRPRVRSHLAAPRPEVLAAMTDQHILVAIDSASEPVSRAELAETTGLSKPAVSAAAARLLERGVIRETGIREGRRGGVATLFDLNPHHSQSLAVIVQNDLVTVQSRDLCGTVRTHAEEIMSPDAPAEQFIASTNRLINEAISAFDAPTRAVAVSLADLVDLDPGEPVIRDRAVFPGGAFRPESALDLPAAAKVVVDNDVNWATIGEHRDGALRDCDNFVYVYVGQGLGAGLLLNGRLFRGYRGLAGEIGYLRDATTGTDITQSLVALGFGEPGTYRLDLDRATALILQDPPGPEVLAAAELLAVAIANIVTVLNPRAIAFGGPLGVHPMLVNAMRDRMTSLSIDPPQFVVSRSTPLRGAELEAHQLVLQEAGLP